MDIQTVSDSVHKPPPFDYHSNVDTSRPFSSVKEAVAVFGERLLTGELYAYRKPNNEDITFTKQESPSQWRYASSALSTPKQASWERLPREGYPESPNAHVVITSTLKKLEAELEDTKMELKLLKERESETEVTLATLNAELHKNMSKIAKAEAEEAARARSSMVVGGNNNGKRDVIARAESSSPTLAQILSINGKEKDQKEKKKKERKNMMKKKPIIPLVGDLFFRKKESSNALHNPLFSSSHLFWN